MFQVEDGSGLPDANSFASVAFADAYFADRGVTTWAGPNADKQTALVRGTDYINSFFEKRFKGVQLTDTQALCFPRDVAGALPTALLKATSEYALRALTGTQLAPDLQTSASGQLVLEERKKLGPLEKETKYSERTAATMRAYPAADALLTKLLKYSSGVMR